MSEMEPEFEIDNTGICLHYLEALQKDLDLRACMEEEKKS